MFWELDSSKSETKAHMYETGTVITANRKSSGIERTTRFLTKGVARGVGKHSAFSFVALRFAAVYRLLICPAAGIPLAFDDKRLGFKHIFSTDDQCMRARNVYTASRIRLVDPIR